jgi:hypothetical protein
VPIFSYLFTVGSLLLGLLLYANSVMAPVSSPFSVSQQIGLPPPFKAPAAVPPAPEAVVVAKAEMPVKPKSEKVARKRKPSQTARPAAAEQQRYADYPRRESGSIW